MAWWYVPSWQLTSGALSTWLSFVEPRYAWWNDQRNDQITSLRAQPRAGSGRPGTDGDMAD
jgi:hypothetical protein